MSRKIIFATFLLVSLIFGKEKNASIINIHYGISPDIRGIDYFEYNQYFGILFQIPKQKNLRFGFNFIITSWSSYELYWFEESLLSPGHKVGKTDNLHLHLLAGYSININWIFNKDSQYWDKTSFSTGCFFGIPDAPYDGWLVDPEKYPIKRKTVIVPFVRVERPFIAKYPWITGVLQTFYIHGAGILITFLFGFNMKII